MSPKAKKVIALNDTQIEVEFTNGERKTFDLKPILHFPVYQNLKSFDYFKQVFINNGIVQWPNEEDLSPDLLYLDSK